MFKEYQAKGGNTGRPLARLIQGNSGLISEQPKNSVPCVALVYLAVK